MATPLSTARALLGRVYRSARSQAEAARIQSVRRSIAAGHALQDKVAVITGASSGIGLAITTAFARAGAHCVLVAREREAGTSAANELASWGLLVELGVADVSDPEQVRDLALTVSNCHEKVDILVNNAGVFLDDDRQMQASAVDDTVVQRTLAVNLYGALHFCSSFAPLMGAGGRIINISSVMGQLSRTSDGDSPAYRLSKAALNSYTQSLAADLRSRGVMVDCMHPGWVKTAIGGPNAMIDPEDAIDTAFFLATRPSSNETGLFWWNCQTIKW
ncbi:MAG TPA: SDR family NAD(P)-dependent oxidoreductase [Candidatus Eremiobacteraceae bacterium]|nr:SDR family NAD(P)-dependent oxidoreductase [Candidatus Eremiobacteraceae bacterium]